jgi:hypothetical protein
MLLFSCVPLNETDSITGLSSLGGAQMSRKLVFLYLNDETDPVYEILCLVKNKMMYVLNTISYAV